MRLVLALLMLACSAASTAQIARVVSVQGTVALERGGSSPRIVGTGDALEQKDVLNVAQSSNSIVEFRDRTRVTLRPNTIFRVENYSDTGDQSLVLGLVKGGMRAVSGDIAKRSPTAMRVQTGTTILGVRGTDFDARICAGDCAAEQNAKPAARTGAVVARAVDIRGIVSAGVSKDAGRFLVPGAAIYAGETVMTNADAHAVVAFADDTRVTLVENSALQIERFAFDRANPRANAAQMHLVSGNAHVWTGEIARNAPAAFQFKTAAGTITANAADGKVAQSATAPLYLADSGWSERSAAVRSVSDTPPEWAALLATSSGFIRTATDTSDGARTGFSTGSNGGQLVIFAWNGSVFLQAGDRRIEVEQPSVVAIAIVGGQVTFLAGPPDFLKASLRPDGLKIDPSTFGSGTDTEDGLYVWVRDGLVELGDLKIPAGFAGVANKNGLRLLDSVPNFFRFDLTPPPGLQPGPFMLRIFRGPDGSTLNMCIAN